MVFRHHTLFVFLLAFLALCTSIQAAPSPDCVAVQTIPLPPDKNPSGGTVQITLTNQCGKDITAYGLVYRNSDGQMLGGMDQELLDSLAFPPSVADIFRRGKSITLPYDPSQQPFTVLVTVAIFLDGSTFGSPTDVARLVSIRTRELERFKDQLKMLESVSSWSAAVNLQERADEAKAAQSRNAWYWQSLAQQPARSDASAWEAFVNETRKSLLRRIELFKLHLEGAAKQ